MIANNHGLFMPELEATPEMPKLRNSSDPLVSSLVTIRRGRSESTTFPFYWTGQTGSARDMLDRLDPWPAEVPGIVYAVVPSALPPNVPNWCAQNLGPDWSVSSVWDARAEAPQVWWTHTSGRRVGLISAGVWFGPGDYTAEACYQAERSLRMALRVGWHGYDPAPVLCPTPATTGRVLFQTHMRPGDGYRVLSPEVQTFIRSTSGQGRTEFVPESAAYVLDLFEIDCRLAYLSLCDNLPTGDPVILDHLPTGDLIHRNWRALVRWVAPEGWDHLGLLPERRPDGRWHYPYSGAGWVDRSEWYLAKKWGWSVACDQAIVWPGHGDPLGNWAGRLVACCDWLDDNRPAGDGYRMVRHALRHIGLDAVGAFHGAPRRTTHMAEHAGAVPDDATDVRFEGDLIAYEAPAPIGWAATMAHPEWSSTVWARCRARIMDGNVHKATGRHEGEGALYMNVREIVAIQTDSLIATAPPPWPETGRAGCLRVKAQRTGPFAMGSMREVLYSLGKGGPR